MNITTGCYDSEASIFHPEASAHIKRVAFPKQGSNDGTRCFRRSLRDRSQFAGLQIVSPRLLSITGHNIANDYGEVAPGRRKCAVAEVGTEPFVRSVVRLKIIDFH